MGSRPYPEVWSDHSDFPIQALRNVTEYLSVAKNITALIFLPSNVMKDIDKLNVDLEEHHGGGGRGAASDDACRISATCEGESWGRVGLGVGSIAGKSGR
ncbi:hypothetical protein CDL15_Pgr028741 [Punica granatum]|uniref:Uncharacterized protein n=1 Tax=Punica granatum TaxID=22663 RepID=A0A218VXH2_PUNGR|nr:hypothetical protein CDL15_Pgr028741 [Punica granatum]PKI44029.1 hypothetical protein CRG98_035559 [Punica granatum]